MDSIIKFDNVTFEYEGEENTGKVLENFSLEIERGTFNVILGHNGSGKSTLAKLTNGLIKAKSGQVLVNGEVLDEPYYDGVTSIMDYAISYPVTVEEGTVFVMGDNRPNSKDSRSSDLGLVPIDAIEGKSQIRIWPFSAIGKTK